MPYAHLGHEPIEAVELERRVGSEAHGAVCTFIGQTRNNARGRNVAYLDYDAFVPLAAKELRRIAEEAEARWGCVVAIQHRLGRVALGEASVMVAVGSPHRAQAFEACRWCIDTLKETVPIWKRETCPDGTYWIEGEDAVKRD